MLVSEDCPVQRISCDAHADRTSEFQHAVEHLDRDFDLTQELEGFRFGTSAPLAVLRRKATELNQAGLIRMKRQRELPQPIAHSVPETARVGLMLESDDEVVGIPDHDHVARGLAPSPAFGP